MTQSSEKSGPFGLSKNKSEEAKEKGLITELNNGRLAQIGIIGFLAADKVLDVRVELDDLRQQRPPVELLEHRARFHAAGEVPVRGGRRRLALEGNARPIADARATARRGRAAPAGRPWHSA